jgi:excisionase family DNA binding protein
METTKDPTLIPIREAAKLAGVSYVTIWRLVHRGEIEAVRVGEGHGPLRIPVDEFRAWLYGDPKEAT